MRCPIKSGIKFRRGDTSAEHPGLVFRRYGSGKEEWVTPERLSELREHLSRYEKARWNASARIIDRRKNRAELLKTIRSPKHQEEQRRKACEYTKSYYRLNPHKVNEWRSNNKERQRAAERKCYHKKMQDPQWKDRRLTRRKAWLARRANELREYRRKRRQQAQVKLADNIRRRINWFLQHRGSAKSASTEQLLGCSFETLRLHLEVQFKEGMTWDNFGVNGWHVDHKLPISMFDLRSEKMQKIAFNFQNLQPLWRQDNLAKSDKITLPNGQTVRGRELRAQPQKIVPFKAA
jgi:hypothetical protein